MTDSFVETSVIANLPSWFVSVFKENDRLCIPYFLSIKDLDDIIRGTSADTFIFDVEIPGFEAVEAHAPSALDLMNMIHLHVFGNSPAEAVVLCKGRRAWIYFDGDQRFSVLIAPREIIKECYPNQTDVMKWYFVDRIDDISLGAGDKIALFESITTT